MVAAVVAALLSVVSVVSAPAAAAAGATTGTAGYFTPSPGRALDTRANGGAPFAGGSWHTVTLSGAGANIPASGVASVALTVTVVTPVGSGWLSVAPDGAPRTVPSTASVSWDGTATVSNTAYVAVSSQVKVQVYTATTAHVIVDVQGYFAAGDGSTAAGGFVPASNGGTRLLDTRTSQGGPGPVSGGASLTVPVGGTAGVPATASAVFANISVLSHDPASGYITAYPTGTPRPGTSLNFGGNQITALASAVDLNAAGQLTITVGATGVAPVDILVDVQGYYTAAAAGTTGVFTPVNARLYDTRVAPAVALAPNTLRKVQVSGTAGLADVSTGLAAEVLELTTVSSHSTDDDVLKVWGTDQPEPDTSAVNVKAAGIVSNLVTTAPGADNSIWVRNTGNSPVDLVVDAEGVYTTPAAPPPPTPSAGARANATRLGFTVSGTAGVSVDVATGNAMITDGLLSLPGITTSVPLAVAFNSTAVGSAQASSLGATGNGWVFGGFDQTLTANPDGTLTYVGPGGLSGVFTPVAGSSPTRYTAPPEFQADLLAAAGGGWTMTTHAGHTTLSFTATGVLSWTADRNGNRTTFGRDPDNNPSSVTTSRGSAGVATTTTAVATANHRITTLTEAAGGLSRTVRLGYDPAARISTITDPVGGVTTFGYGTGSASSPTGQVVSITNPSGQVSTLTYAGAKVTAITQTNTATGSPGSGTTRLSYPSAAQTLVADPTTNQTAAVSAVAHTTYALTTDGTALVAAATDPDGHAQSATYNPQNNTTLTQTSAAGGQTTYTYGANNGESLTAAASPGGATAGASYTNTGAAQYLPSSFTNSAGNGLSYTYNGAGNPLTSAQATVTATVGYNTLGQPTTSQSPGAPAGVATSYGYDTTSHDLTSITPVPGTSLGARSYTWDGFGRLVTATDGRGDTTTYSYDNADRVTTVAYSDGTHPVTYTYDAQNRPTRRVDASGTTTWVWDDLGRLLNTTNTAGGGGETYRYDQAGALVSKADTSGPTTYTYSPAHRVTTLTYQQGGQTETTQFGYDAAGRRTDVWMQTDGAVDAHGNANPGVWAAHEHTTYDTSGRVTAVLGQQGPATAPTTVVNQAACYNTSSPAPTCSSAPGGDQGRLAFLIDHVNGQTATFGYDDHTSGQGQTGRLLSTTITGGPTPRTYHYAYTAAGDRTTATVTGATPGTQTLAYNNANQISTAGYTYDGAGNLTATPDGTQTFNTAAQQVTATRGGVATHYTYAGTNSDELLSESTPGGHTYALTYGRPDSSGLPEVEQVHYDNTTAYVQHDPTTGAPLMLQTSNGVTCLYLTDITNNPILLSTSFNTTSFAESYDPYGAATQTAGGTNGGVTQNPYLYHFGLQDRITGNIKFGARFYNPTTGTWTQQDTLNAPLDPHNANRYLYAGGDPINATDPSGQFGFNSFFKAVGAAVTTVAAAAGAGAGLATCGPSLGTGCLAGAASAGVAITGAAEFYTQFNNAVNE